MTAAFVMTLAAYVLPVVLVIGAIIVSCEAYDRRSMRLGCLAGGVIGTALLAVSWVVAFMVIQDRHMPQDPGRYRIGTLPNGVFVTLALMGMALIVLSLVTYGVIWLRSECRKVSAES